MSGFQFSLVRGITTYDKIDEKILTCIGLAAISKPATPPPITRPSGLANETLNPPDRLFIPPLSEMVYDPVRVKISKRPCINRRVSVYTQYFEKNHIAIQHNTLNAIIQYKCYLSLTLIQTNPQDVIFIIQILFLHQYLL